VYISSCVYIVDTHSILENSNVSKQKEPRRSEVKVHLGKVRERWRCQTNKVDRVARSIAEDKPMAIASNLDISNLP
jgi:hypothetical protein